MAMTREEFEARKAQKRATDTAARKEQEGIDYEAIAALEDDKAIDVDTSLSVQTFVSGYPAVLGVRCPTRVEYKRLTQRIHRAAAKGASNDREKAVDELAESCWIYPSDKEARDAIMTANPATLTQIGLLAQNKAELESAEEGKG